MKILVGCNLLDSVNTVAYPNHMQFWYKLGKNHPEKDFYFHTPRRKSIDRMRNECAKLAMEIEADYLLFYDDDVLLPLDTLELLLDAQADIAAGVTLVRGTPFNPMVFKEVYDEKGNRVGLTFFKDFEEEADENGIVACAAVGFSCCLIDVQRTLLRMSPPYFVTGPNNTEDVYFCEKARQQLGEDLSICVNTSLVTGHLLDNYYISPQTKEIMLETEKKLSKNMIVEFEGEETDERRKDRGKAYRERIFEQLRQGAKG